MHRQYQAAAYLHLVADRSSGLRLLGQGIDLSTQGASGLLERGHSALEAEIITLQVGHLGLQVVIHLHLEKH